MVCCFSALTGGGVSKIVSQSLRKENQLPINNHVDALEDFHSQHVGAASTTEIYAAFEVNWNAQQARNIKEKKEKKTIVRVLWNTFWKDVLKAAFLKLLWGVLLIFSIAFFVFRILAYIRFKSTDPVHTIEEASVSYILCAFFFLSMVCLSVSLQQMTFASTVLGQRVKAALTTAIYRKMLIREGFESDADIVSLVAKDCPKIAEACTSLQFLWSGVFEALGIFAVLISFIGISALPGLGFLLVCLPLQYALGMWLAVKKTHLAKDSKKRIKLMEEILRGIKLIKIYGWESYFRDAIDAYRAHEGAVVDAINRIKSVILGIVFSCPPFFCLVIFGTQEALGSFDGTLAFTTLTFFNTLRLPLVKLPKGLRDVLDAKLALERIEAFLLESELPDRPKPVDAPPTADATADASPPTSDATVNAALVMVPELTIPADITPYTTGTGITFAASSFAYGARAPALLHDINLSLPKGSLAMVAGPVASGKTNLLRAVLGHMTCQSGSRAVDGAFAYVPQVQ
jgi:ABC-type multidrug transport system fused ATPase/permease subunit